MNLHGITVLACMALFRDATCLQCYVCSTTPGRADTPGCTPGSPMDDRFLKKCEPAQLYCVTATVKAFWTAGGSVTNINFLCESSSVSACINDTGSDPIDYSTSCFTSCTTDGCNGHPATKQTSASSPVSTDAPTSVPKTASPNATTTTNAASASPPVSTDAPTSVPKTASPNATATTNAAKAMRLNVHTFRSLFISVMCALLFSGLNRND